MLIAWSLLVVAGAIVVATRAAANGYLVVLYWGRRGLYLLERGADERYHLFAVYLLPLVLARYLTLSAAYMLLLLHDRSRARVHTRKPIAAVAKA
jgi:hypothetical protein